MPGTSIAALVKVSGTIAATRSRKRKIEAMVPFLRGLLPEEIGIAVSYLAGVLPQGRVGLGWATVRAAVEDNGQLRADLGEAQVDLLELNRVLSEIQQDEGAGSGRRRKARLGGLVARLGQAERDFVAKLILGELRQGAKSAIVVDALAAAIDIDSGLVRRAMMIAGSLAEVARATLIEGHAGLAKFRLAPFRPILPMLATAAEDIDGALSRLGEAAFEVKLDGARVQVHKDGDDVRVYSRRLHDVSERVPEMLELVRDLPVRNAIFDGETIALKPNGRPEPFQTTMKRFGRRRDVETMREKLPLSTHLFDVIHLDDETLLDQPATVRHRALASVVPASARIERRVLSKADEVEAFWAQVLSRGHEGLMAKDLHASYEAGSRGFSWLKLKPAHSLDLVVLAVERGSGRRQGWLSNLHLGARDPETDGFVMLGKTFKGMTDEMLAWQTEYLSERATETDGHVVHVRPELVVEIAFNDVQQSPHYPGGYALRFARVKRYRRDKDASSADTIESVREIFERSR